MLNTTKYRKNYYKTNKAHLQKYSKDYYTRITVVKRLKKDFGISLEDYNRLFAEQKGLCLGCYKHQSQLKGRLAVDHCHKTGKVRGLLCTQCNLSLGNAFDDAHILRRLAEYIDAC